jgi:hypothetical protein
VHCRKLLDDQHSPTGDHRRLTRLARRGRGKVARRRFTSGNAKLTDEKWNQKFFVSALEIISGFSSSIFAGRQLGPAD